MFVFFIILSILIVIACVIFYIFRHRFIKPRCDSLNMISGAVGGGKTSSAVCRCIKHVLNPIYFLGKSKKVQNDYIVLSSFPIGKHYDKKKGALYLRLGLFQGFKKIYTYDMDIDIYTLQKKLPQSEVIILQDEFAKIASQLDYNNPTVKNNMDEFFSLFRHYTKGLGYMFAIDQCTNNIFFEYRRRSGYCYNMVGSKKIPLLPIMIFEFRKILISDEVQNIVETKDATDETELKKMIFFMNPFKYYDSYCYSDRYDFITSTLVPTSRKILKRNDIMKLNQKKVLYYETLQADNISEQDFLSMNIK